MSGLRERNRRRTRRELAATALRLYDERGFDVTTADDLAEAAGVSRSTFFRYFPTKEHAVFADHDEQLAAYRARLATAPPPASPREGILHAAVEASRATVEAFRRDPESYRLRQRVLAAAPSVRQLGLRLERDWEDALAEAFERHLAGGHDARTRARLLAGSLMGTVSAFHRLWAAGGFRGDPAGYRDEIMAVFDLGVSGVVG